MANIYEVSSQNPYLFETIQASCLSIFPLTSPITLSPTYPPFSSFLRITSSITLPHLSFLLSNYFNNRLPPILPLHQLHQQPSPTNPLSSPITFSTTFSHLSSLLTNYINNPRPSILSPHQLHFHQPSPTYPPSLPTHLSSLLTNYVNSLLTPILPLYQYTSSTTFSHLSFLLTNHIVINSFPCILLPVFPFY